MVTILWNKQYDFIFFVCLFIQAGCLEYWAAPESSLLLQPTGRKAQDLSCAVVWLDVSGYVDQKALNQNQRGKRASGWISVSGLCATRVIGKEEKTLPMYWIIKLGKRELRGTCHWYQWQQVVIERVRNVSLLTVTAESASCVRLLNCAVCVWLRSRRFCSQMQLQRGEVQMPRGETQWFLANRAPWMQTPKSTSIGPPKCGYTAGKDSSTDRISPVGESDGPIMLMREDVKNAWELLISSLC